MEFYLKTCREEGKVFHRFRVWQALWDGGWDLYLFKGIPPILLVNVKYEWKEMFVFWDKQCALHSEEGNSVIDKLCCG